MKTCVSVLLWLGQKYSTKVPHKELFLNKYYFYDCFFFSVVIQTGSGTIVLLDKHDIKIKLEETQDLCDWQVIYRKPRDCQRWHAYIWCMCVTLAASSQKCVQHPVNGAQASLQHDRLFKATRGFRQKSCLKRETFRFLTSFVVPQQG